MTRQGNRPYPYVISFGFRDAPEDVMQSLAYPNFGRTKGRWFHARTSRIGELLEALTSAIGTSVLSSVASAAVGVPYIVPPMLSDEQMSDFDGMGDNV